MLFIRFQVPPNSSLTWSTDAVAIEETDGRTALAQTIPSGPKLAGKPQLKRNAALLECLPLRVLETELDTAGIVADKDFATVSRSGCIIRYYFSLYGCGQMQNRAKFA